MSEGCPPAELRTARLLLRAVRASDAPQVFEAISESLPALRAFPAFLPWAMEAPSLQASTDFCATAEAAFAEGRDFAYGVRDGESHALLGCIGLHRVVRAVPKAEIGYWLRSRCTGSGHMREAVQTLSRAAMREMGLARLEIVTDAENLAARRVAEACDYTLEAVLRHERRAPGGTLRDTAIYARLPASAVPAGVAEPATTLAPMSPDRFAHFLHAMVADYAQANVAAGRWPAEGAEARAQADVATLLPQGLLTPRHMLLDILASPDGPSVGGLWWAQAEQQGEPGAFVYQLLIEPAWRRQGHARRAMAALAPLAQAMGLRQIGLHVFAHNHGAQRLYQALGYQATGHNLRLRLPPQKARDESRDPT